MLQTHLHTHFESDQIVGFLCSARSLVLVVAYTHTATLDIATASGVMVFTLASAAVVNKKAATNVYD